MALKDIAKHLAKKGRYGDKHLLHVSDDELRAVIASRGLTLNPHTGLPEAWSPFHGDFSIHGTAGKIAKLVAGPPAFLTGGATGANIAKNVISGDPVTKHAEGAAAVDIAGLGAGAALGPTGVASNLWAGAPAASPEAGSAYAGADAEAYAAGINPESGAPMDLAGAPAASPEAGSAYAGADAEAYAAGINPESGAPMDLGAEQLGGEGVDIPEAVGNTGAVPLGGPEEASAGGASGGGGGGGGGGNWVTRYGPLALGGAGLAQNYFAGKRAQKQLSNVGAAQRDEGQKLLNQFNSGQLTVADAHNIATYEASATAAAKQYFAKSGQSTSTAANSTLATIQANVAAMKDQALQNYLKLGTTMLNATDEAQIIAIEQGIKNDQQMWQMIFNFGQVYGQWNRSLTTMTSP